MMRLLAFGLGLAVVACPATADIVQIHDLSGPPSVTLTHDRPSQLGSISDIVVSGDSITFTFTLANQEFFLANLHLYRLLLDPDHTLSDVWRFDALLDAHSAVISFASDPDTLDVTGYTKLPSLIETGLWQTMFTTSGVDIISFQVASAVPEPNPLALLALGGLTGLAVSSLRKRAEHPRA